MPYTQPRKVKTVSEFRKLCGLPSSEHPLISLINLDLVQHSEKTRLMLDFYSISIKRGLQSKFQYGQSVYDFDEGVMFFIAPNQVYGKVEPVVETSEKVSGWMLLIHPDFFWNTPLSKKIKQYEFFNYSVHEALFISSGEEKILNTLVEQIEKECKNNIDHFSKKIITSYIEALLNYAERFYHRQFITREQGHHQIVERLEELLTDYFNSEDLILKGLPTVQYVAATLNISPGYLSNLLRVLTGQSTQQHIHHKLIEKAKEKLSTTHLTVSEIAYELGFEHLQSFSKFFKAKTKRSPLEYRKLFN